MSPDDFLLDPLFESYAWRTGFRELRPDETLEDGDVLLMSIMHPTLNHVAIFTEGMVLHHLTDRLSCREPYSEWLLKCTGKRYRYAQKVKLYGELADFVGHKELDAVINNTADAIRFLVTNFDGLHAHMATRTYKILVDDYEVGEDEIHHPIGSQGLSIVPVVTGSGDFGKILLGGALLALSFGAFGAFGGGLTFGKGFSASFATATFGAKAAFGIGAALVLSGVSDLLFPLPQMPDFSNEEDPLVYHLVFREYKIQIGLEPVFPCVMEK